MKFKIGYCFCLAMLLAVLPVMFFAGCETTQAGAYKSLAATSVAVEAAMNTYGELYRAGEIDAEEEAKVDEAYESFIAAYRVALTAAKFDVSAATPVELAAMASLLILEVDAL